jgi:hypothetical protein
VRWIGCAWTVRIASTVQSVGTRFLSSDWLLCFLLFFFFKPFPIHKREFFVKEVPKTTLEIAPTHFLKLLDHIISTIHLLVDPGTFPRYF